MKPTQSTLRCLSVHRIGRCLQQGSLEEMQMVNMMGEKDRSVSICKRQSWSSKQWPAREGHGQPEKGVEELRMDVMKIKFSVQRKEPKNPENLIFSRIVGGKILC